LSMFFCPALLAPTLCLTQVIPYQVPTPLVAQEIAAAQEIVLPHDVRPLPGGLDQVAVFNSNSPEIISRDGILLSTFPPKGMRQPAAHLNYAFEGRFDLFAHHIGKPASPQASKTVYFGLVIANPESRPVELLVMEANSYLTRNAPFVALSGQVEERRRVYSGPGSRMSGSAVRRERGLNLPVKITLAPGETKLFTALPITAPNGRSTLMRLYSSGKLYMASLAMSARREGGSERAPTLSEWQNLLQTGELVAPRDRVPTPPGKPPADGRVIYGRVAGVAQGAEWRATLTDPGSETLTLPKAGGSVSFAINTLDNGTLGTNQIQSAPMIRRYPDTAYRAHGNYGITYNLTIPLANPSNQPQQVTLALQTPLKENRLSRQGLRFLNPPAPQVFFRGSVRVQYADAQGQNQVRYLHLVQRRGQQGEPLVQLTLPPNARQSVQVEFVYPPDATPPQVFTIQTLGNNLPSAAVP
jgi:Protein of unknown function (DUF3370)